MLASTPTLAPTDTPATAPTSADPITVVKSFWAAANAKQLDTAMAYLAEDATFISSWGRFFGKDKIRWLLQRFVDGDWLFEQRFIEDTNGRVTYTQNFTQGKGGETYYVDWLIIVENGKITFDGVPTLAPRRVPIRSPGF